ncbi:Ig-like domain-containing protein [Paenibacillus sp. YPG26]|uniref:Ig-like domain-containing protein n=1 Tax=Paenibacillus sp. YPG26 TaxID=2878915 RepID=UPI00203F909F|nr:Ig-like domain-containing protein [Paenibacillus sp. YPG26]USB33588.1 Ig-like domain-containing protein [Paenibacillus sp. YPG26]
MRFRAIKKTFTCLLAIMLLVMTALPQAQPVYASGLDITGTGNGWLTIYPKNGQFDYIGDQQTGSGSVAQDIVGDADHPPFYVNYDSAAGEIGYRIRVNNLDGTQKDKFGSFAFVGVDANQDGGIDFFLGAYNPTNNNGRIGIYYADPNKTNMSPSTTGIINPPTKSYAPVANENFSLLQAAGSSFSGDADFFVTFKIKVADINTAMAGKGINVTASSPLQYIIGTAAQDNSFNQDIGGTKGISTNDATTWRELGVYSPPVTVTGEILNAAPIAVNDTLTVAENTPGSVIVTDNDTDAENGLDPSTVAIKTQPQHGTATPDSSGKVTYTPNPGYSGSDSFTYTVKDTNGAESSPATVTVTVTAAPVNTVPNAVNDTLTAAENTPGSVIVTANDTDAENGLDPSTVTIKTQPQHGTATPDSSGKVTYTPNPGYSGSDSFTYTVKDTNGAESSPATVTVTVTAAGIPLAQPQLVELDEGSEGVKITLAGTDDGTNDELIYNISDQPAKGTLLRQGSNLYLYTPASEFTSGTDSFSFTVTDENGKTSLPAKVTIRMNKALNGWVGSKQEGDPALVKAVPGHPLKLSAVSSLAAQEVKAKVADETVSLVLVNPGTFLEDGYKRWENSSYILTAPLAAGSYTAEFHAFQSDSTPLGAETRLADNHFQVLAYSLALKAVPDRIVGDGRSTTELTAVLTDNEGNPVPDTEVVFSVPSGLGTFVGDTSVLTDAQGRASITYRSSNLSSNKEQKVRVEAGALDLDKGISAKDHIQVTFQPAVISGIITRGALNEKVAGAKVRVTLDLNGDDVITPGEDFDETVVTGADGAYSLAVPQGDAVYTIRVTQNVNIGGVSTPVTYTQTAVVGNVSGTGQESYDSTKTATGIILLKQPNGGAKLISGDLVQKTKVYLRNAATGLYIMENGSPKAFAAQPNGVFNAEGLGIGTYTMEIRYEIEPGQEIIVQKSEVHVTDNGQMNISEELVDPYGDITNSVTGAPVEGAKVMLYYAATARNGSKGGQPVLLPAIPGFEPNDNASPEQLSDANGMYAYMVYPHTDYYLVVTKSGYETYTSPIIPVELEIVRHDISLKPISTPVPNNPAPNNTAPVNTTISPVVTVSLDKNLIKEGENSVITVNYSQTGNGTLTGGMVTLTLPEGAVVVQADGGTIAGNTVTWPVGTLGPNQGGTHRIVVQWPMLSKAEQEYDLRAALNSGSQTQPATAAASAKLKLYSDRYGELKHQRYILGYPDTEFKPAKSLTRAELAAIVARLTENPVQSGNSSYSDVPSSHWAADYITTATKQGYFSGYADGTFRPEAPVTRGEIATVMAKFLKIDLAQAVRVHFTDLKGHWASTAIEHLYNGKFLSGYPNGTFKPDINIKRAEAVTMINRMLYRGPLSGLKPQFPDVPATHWGFGDIQEATQSHESNRKDGGEIWVQTLSDNVK